MSARIFTDISSLPPPLKDLGKGKGHRFKDYSGEVINNIKILYPVDKDNTGHILFMVQCHCGNYFITRIQRLKNNNTTSCGCIKSKNTITRNHKKTEEIIGENIGYLTVLNFYEYRLDKNGNRNAYYQCFCNNCGSTSIHRGSDLKNHSILSCGCVNSRKELEIAQLLTGEGINFKKQYTFIDLKDPQSGYPLRFDFAIFDKDTNLKCLIEYQGEQHYDKNNPWYTETLIKHDNMKKDYCKNHHILLIEYNKNTDLNSIIKGGIIDDRLD